jgi:hypothetical protein
VSDRSRISQQASEESPIGIKFFWMYSGVMHY